ncbi:type VI secretion system tip protein VgrG [Paraburkholderia acidiphila]|uniref:Type VI secretion system tip protein VgrG n=2 Tax=Paraburkholderia acidiphila TaxID=2571747 RepID=A0A7Z2JDP3_9BURK|nr:type VI secretion system tip protein VgrG [Paraburkholderia acidiphila]
MPHVAEAARADIFSFTGHRAIGEPDKYTIQFTHTSPDLSRSDFLNHMAAFVIQPPPPTRWSEPEAPRRVQGVITAFAQFPGSPDQTTYEITLESRLALLRNTPRYRHFLDKKDPEIIQQILKEHEFNQIFAETVFDLYREYRKRPIVMQWGEDDLAFIQRLCRRSGIWFVCEEGKLCGRVRFGDDFSKYTRDRERFERPYHDPGGLLTSGRESVKSLVTRSATMAASQVVRSFSPDEPLGLPIEAERESERVRKGKDWVADRTTYGEAYAWGIPYSDAQAAKEEVTLRHEAARAAQVIYTGTCDMLDIAPACVVQLSNRTLPDAAHGILITAMTCSASRKEGYKVAFAAIPADRQYRMPLLEHTWPRIPGVITGTIAATKDYEGPYLDDQGRYIVHLHTDRDERVKGLESCPMRLAKPFAGPGVTGFHFGLEPETVVIVRLGLSRTTDMKYRGVGLVETQLSPSDFARAREVHDELCKAAIAKPETDIETDPEMTYSLRCMQDGKLAAYHGQFRDLTKKEWFLSSKFQQDILANYADKGRSIVKFDVRVPDVHREKDKFAVAVAFVNSGRYPVQMITPDNWDRLWGQRLDISGFRVGGGGEWRADLAGQSIINKSDYPVETVTTMGKSITTVKIPPGETVTYKFLAVPTGKVPKGQYKFGTLVYASITVTGVNGAGGTVNFLGDEESAPITFDRDFPSTPDEWKDYESRQRARLSEHVILPGNAVAEDGYYRLISETGQRSRWVYPFNQGGQSHRSERIYDSKGEPFPLRPLPVWQWEADLARSTLCSPGEPCPREGIWAGGRFGHSFNTPDEYMIHEKRTFRAGEIMPPVIAYGANEVPYASWYWLGA